MPTTPILDSKHIAAVDQNGNPVRLVADTNYDPPRLLVHALATNNTGLPAVYTEKAEYSNGIMIYQGWAAPGTATSAAGWVIVKYTYSGTQWTDKKFADGSVAFDQVWDDRASLTYS